MKTSNLRNTELHDPVVTVGPAGTRLVAFKHQGWLGTIEIFGEFAFLQ